MKQLKHSRDISRFKTFQLKLMEVVEEKLTKLAPKQGEMGSCSGKFPYLLRLLTHLSPPLFPISSLPLQLFISMAFKMSYSNVIENSPTCL